MPKKDLNIRFSNIQGLLVFLCYSVVYPSADYMTHN